jgi:hypothetical protein
VAGILWKEDREGTEERHHGGAVALSTGPDISGKRHSRFLTCNSTHDHMEALCLVVRDTKALYKAAVSWDIPTPCLQPELSTKEGLPQVREAGEADHP